MSGAEQDDKAKGAEREQPGTDAKRTGEYGGGDGATEHESGETNTPEDTGSKVEPGRKAGA